MTTSYLIHVSVAEFSDRREGNDCYWEDIFINPGSTVPERLMSEEEQKSLPPEDFQKWGHFWITEEEFEGTLPEFPGLKDFLLGARGVLAITKVIEGPEVWGGRQKIVIL